MGQGLDAIKGGFTDGIDVVVKSCYKNFRMFWKSEKEQNQQTQVKSNCENVYGCVRLVWIKHHSILAELRMENVQTKSIRLLRSAQKLDGESDNEELGIVSILTLTDIE